MAGVPGWGVNLVSQSRAHKQNREEAEKDRALRKKLHDRQMNQQLGLALGQMAAKYGGQALQAGISNYRDDRLAKIKAGVWPGQNEKVTRGDYVVDALDRGASGRALGLTRQEDYAKTKAPVTASPAPVSAPEAQPRSSGAGPVLKHHVIEEALDGLRHQPEGTFPSSKDRIPPKPAAAETGPKGRLPSGPIFQAPTKETWEEKLADYKNSNADHWNRHFPELTPAQKLDAAQLHRSEEKDGVFGDGDLQFPFKQPNAQPVAQSDATRNADHWNRHFPELTPAQKLDAAQLHRSEEKDGVFGDGDLQFPFKQPNAQPVAQPDAPSLDGPTMTMAEHSGLKMDPWLRMSLNNRRAIDEKRYALSQQADRDERRVKVGEGSLRRQEAADQYDKLKWNSAQRTLLLDNSYKTTKGVSEWMAKASPMNPKTAEAAQTIARAGQDRVGYATMRGSLKALHGSIVEDEAGNRRPVTPAEVDGLLRELGYGRAEVQRLKLAYAEGRDAPIEVPMPDDVYNRMPELANLKTRRSAGSARTRIILPRPTPTGGDALNLDTPKFDWDKPEESLNNLSETMPNLIGAEGTPVERATVTAQQGTAAAGIKTFIAGRKLRSKPNATPEEVEQGRQLEALGQGITNRAWFEYRRGNNIRHIRRSKSQKKSDEDKRNAPTEIAKRNQAFNDKATARYNEETKKAGSAWTDALASVSGQWQEGHDLNTITKVVKRHLGDSATDLTLLKKYAKAIYDKVKIPLRGNKAQNEAFLGASGEVERDDRETGRKNRTFRRKLIRPFIDAHPKGTPKQLNETLKDLDIPIAPDAKADKRLFRTAPRRKPPTLKKLPKRINATSVDRPQQDIAGPFVAIRDYVKENFPPARQQGAFMRMANAKREEMERAGIMTRQQGDEFFGTSSRSRLS